MIDAMKTVATAREAGTSPIASLLSSQFDLWWAHLSVDASAMLQVDQKVKQWALSAVDEIHQAVGNMVRDRLDAFQTQSWSLLWKSG
jgi:uncharacterized membrane-anchored protein YjiN (DUF445 family)